jgi:hypothetical protein
MKSVWTLCAICILAAGLVAQTTEAKPKKAKSAPITAADVQALKDAIAAQQSAIQQQQQQIQQLQDQLQRRDQAVQQARSAATEASSKADSAASQASQQQEAVSSLKSDVGDLKTGFANTVSTLQETQKAATQAPTALHFRGVTLTPGGFFAAESVYRTRALGADINTPFNSLTMPGASQSAISEFFGSGRQSRISMLAEAKLKGVKLSGYYETDFLSAAVTSNNNQSNSYSLRQRQFWGQFATEGGWSLTGGQMWSLVTETKKGLDNRSEALPMTIDAQYTVGFSWARQYGVRLVKNFNNKAWFGVSVENPQATISTHGNAANFLVGSAGAGGGLYNGVVTACSAALNSSGTSVTTTCTPAASYSFNPSPDIVAKLAFEPGFGHYEVFGVYSRFRDRIFPCAEASATVPCALNGAIVAPSTTGAYNSGKNGGGVGANARWSFANKHVDFGLHGFGGSGVGRYGTSGLADASINGIGQFNLVKSLQGLTTLEFHYPKVDVYFNAGAEYASRKWDVDPISGKTVGYGAPTFANTACYTETLPANGTGFLPGSLGSSCTADTRVLIEGTAGFWYKVWDGSKEKVNWGRIQFGPQYSYVVRNTWSGTGGQPHGLDNMVFTSFRYYLP